MTCSGICCGMAPSSALLSPSFDMWALALCDFREASKRVAKAIQYLGIQLLYIKAGGYTSTHRRVRPHTRDFSNAEITFTTAKALQLPSHRGSALPLGKCGGVMSGYQAS